MANKYSTESNRLSFTAPSMYGSIILYKKTNNKKHPDEQEVMAIFYGPDAYTNAQKVCDLLNEVSRSQGKHP